MSGDSMPSRTSTCLGWLNLWAAEQAQSKHYQKGVCSARRGGVDVDRPTLMACTPSLPTAAGPTSAAPTW